MLTKTKIVLAAALMLGTASAALARGHVVPGSMDGVNPAYHQHWSPEYGAAYDRANAADEAFAEWRAYNRANAAIYSSVGGYYPSPYEAYRAQGLIRQADQR
jgi:hypothetical protein